MKHDAIALAPLLALAALAAAFADEVAAQVPERPSIPASASGATDQAHHEPHMHNAPPVVPKPGSGPAGRSTQPGDTAQPDNPDNMPIKRPKATTRDRMLHDHLPSDAIAR
jgi:hypothetical protein